jgi:hypothetical protein
MSENSPENWRRVSKGRIAVTHTDERTNHTPVRNQFQELSEHQEDSVAPRKLIVEFTGLQTEEGIPLTDPSDSSDINDDNSNDGDNSTGSINNSSSSNNKSSEADSSSSNDGDNSNEADNTDTGSFGSTKSFDTIYAITSDYASLLETIRLVNAKQATVFSGKKKNYAKIVQFREVLGSALETIPCTTHDCGYSWLVDTEEDYTDRTGATTPYTVQSMPTRPSRPPEPQHSASSEEYKRYAIDLQKYNNYLHWNKEALAALKHRFPKSLTPERNKFEALPITYTIREAVDYLESLVNTDVEKRETYCAIVRDITRRTYQQNLEGLDEYFAAMQCNKHSIDVLKQGELSYDILIIHSQETFRHSGIPMKEMRTIDEAWRKIHDTTHYIGKTKWTAFTDFYTKIIKELQDPFLSILVHPYLPHLQILGIAFQIRFLQHPSIFAVLLG